MALLKSWFQTSNFQSSERTSFRCFKPLSLRFFVMGALGNQQRGPGFIHFSAQLCLLPCFHMMAAPHLISCSGCRQEGKKGQWMKDSCWGSLPTLKELCWKARRATPASILSSPHQEWHLKTQYFSWMQCCHTLNPISFGEEEGKWTFNGQLCFKLSFTKLEFYK